MSTPPVISMSSLREQLGISDQEKLPSASGCCIYRVPTKLRKGNEEAYTPTLISIGPFHYGDKRLESMQDFKFSFFNEFVKRNPEKTFEDYVGAVRCKEYKIRHSYSETVQMEDSKLVCLILMDACFIIEFFLALTASSAAQNLVKNPWPTGYIKLDLLLLENQLPFFVLEDLFKLAFPKGFDHDIRSFIELAFKFFKEEFLRDLLSTELNAEIVNDFVERFLEQPTLEVYHLNNMLRMFYLPDKLPERHRHTSEKPICSASQLREAGIKFKASKRRDIAKVKYSNGVLTIPCFVVRDWTETMIRNVIAFEQCHFPHSSYVTDYIMLWDHLINTEKDVDLLVHKEIIQNFLSDNDAVASMTNRLCRNVVSTSYNSEYIELFKSLNKFYNNPYHKYKAIFRHEYLSTPWKIASFIAAVLLLFLTLIQTICSVIDLFH